MGSNHEKTGGQKSRDTLPLIAFRSRFFTFLKFFHHTIMFLVEKGVQLVHFYICMMNKLCFKCFLKHGLIAGTSSISDNLDA